MTLTFGTGPFSLECEGRFNFVPDASHGHVLYLEDVSWRIRSELGGITVVNSRRATRLYESVYLPVYYVPVDDIRTELLQENDGLSHCPFKGGSRYWSIQVGEHTVEDAVWNYPDPLSESPIPADYVTFYFESMDRWREEGQEIFAHPRDPYHRTDVRESARHVRVFVDGEVIAESEHPRILTETGLPVGYYLSQQDTRPGLHFPNETCT